MAPSAVNGVTRAVNAPRRRGVRAVAERVMRAMAVLLRSVGAGSGEDGDGTVGDEQRVDDRVERVEPGLARLCDQPAGRGERAVRVRGPVAGGEAELDRLARAVEGHEMRPGRGARADAEHL